MANLSQEELELAVINLDRLTAALNTAIVALYKIVDVKGDELDGLTADEYLKFVQSKVHPLVRKADALATEVAEKAAEEAKKAVEEKINAEEKPAPKKKATKKSTKKGKK